MVTLIWILATIVLLAAAAYFRAPGWTWAIAAAASAAGLTLRGGLTPAMSGLLWTLLILAVSAAAHCAVAPRPAQRPTAGLVPQGAACGVADRAGGARRGHRLVGRRAVQRPPGLEQAAVVPQAAFSRAEERAFLDGPVEELCRMCDDWQISHELNDLPPEVWQFIKDQRLPRDDHPEAVRRPGLLRARALRGRDEARQPQSDCVRLGDGA